MMVKLVTERPVLAQVLSGLHMAEGISLSRWVPAFAVQRALRLRGDKLAAEVCPEALGVLVSEGKVEMQPGWPVWLYRRSLTLG
jgi:hypothetical protein